MTATLINGYSSGIFHLLYRLVPGLMRKDDKPYNKPAWFDEEYGVVENIYEIVESDYNSNRRTIKHKLRSKKLPGVSAAGVLPVPAGVHGVPVPVRHGEGSAGL